MLVYTKNRKDSLDYYIEEYQNKYKEHNDDVEEKVEKGEKQEEEKLNRNNNNIENEQMQNEYIEETVDKEDETNYDYIDIKINKNNCVRVESCVAYVEPYKNEKTDVIEGSISLVPVVLAQLELQINIMSDTKFPHDAAEINNIDNNIKITQCMLLQTTNVLFISGYVRKNIEYTTICCSNEEGGCGDIKHCTVDVPFKCNTSIEFNGIEPKKIIYNIKDEFEYHKVSDISNAFTENDGLISSYSYKYNQENIECFNRLSYCNLISARVVNIDEYINRYRRKNEISFEKMEEKMVVYIILEILQERDVLIPLNDYNHIN
ncbi:CsxC family protein [Tepidibacter mesophilus]|uniref:CsxC family protein n=1 Tax=Tepidibacter mesophilus TaxID=655607 RepID=UPI000C073C97|nr:hypothetical protein [Tepidibacter mesophilus]